MHSLKGSILLAHSKDFLKLHAFDSSQLQFEAAWSLINIATGNSNHSHAIVKEGVVPLLIGLLDSPHMDVCENAIWALSNICGTSEELRDLVIAQGITKPLLKFANRNIKVNV